MSEKPILFNAPMVKAILNSACGHASHRYHCPVKNQTRRIIKNHEICNCGEYKPVVIQEGLVCDKCGYGAPYASMGEYLFKCPYGNPGDQLWVRENFWHYGKYVHTGNKTKTGKLEVKFCPIDKVVSFNDLGIKPSSRFVEGFHRRPSIFLPRWASRIQLLIKDVRVERLRDIEETDAYFEGVDHFRSDDGSGYKYLNYLSKEYEYRSAKESFASLWKSINGVESWDSNPFVWVVEFERIKP